MSAFPDNPYSQQNIMMHQLYGAGANNMTPVMAPEMYGQNVYFGQQLQQPDQQYYDTALAQTYYQPQSYMDPNLIYQGQQQMMMGDPYSSQQQLYDLQTLLQQQQQQLQSQPQQQQLQQQLPQQYSQRQNPPQQPQHQYLSIIDRMHDDTKQNPHDLQLLENLEHRLATILADPNATTADQTNVMKIYSEVINNAEAASRNISAQDQHKKMWYRRVLEYQIKEKKFREQFAKQQQIKLDIQQEAAEKAKVEAEKQKEIDANNKVFEQQMELDKFNAEQLALHHTQLNQNGNAQQTTNINQQNTADTQQHPGGLTFYPGQSENYNQITPNYGVGGGGQANFQQYNGELNNNQMNQQQNLGQTSNFAGANDYYPQQQQQQFQQPPPYDPYQQMQLQNLMAEQSKQFFSALTDMITTTIDNTHKQQLELQYSVHLSDDPNDPKYADPLAYQERNDNYNIRGNVGGGGNGGGQMMGYGGRGPEKYTHEYKNHQEGQQQERQKHEYLRRADSPPIPTMMNREHRGQENDNNQGNQDQKAKHEYLRRAESPPIPTLMKGQQRDQVPQDSMQLQQPVHPYLHRGNGNQSDELQPPPKDYGHNNQPPQKNNGNSPSGQFIQGNSPQNNNSNNFQLYEERRPYSPPIPTHQNDRSQPPTVPTLNKQQHQQPLDRKSTDITANNKSLPGFSKFEQYNGAPVTGRSGLQPTGVGAVGNSYLPPGGLNSSRQQNTFFKHEQTFVGPGAAELNAKREQMYQNKNSINQLSGDLPQSANVSNIQSLPGNSKWEKVPTGVPKSFQDINEIAEAEHEDEEHYKDGANSSPQRIGQQHGPSKFQQQHNQKQGLHQKFQQEDDYSQLKGDDPYFQGKDINSGRPGHINKLSPQEPNDLFFEDGIMPSEIGLRDQSERQHNDKTGPGHNFKRDNLLHPMTKVITQRQSGKPTSPQLSLDLSNTEILNDEERKAQRREKIKQNHLKRLKTIETSQQQQQNLKRAESPFLSQHNTFAKELADTTPRGREMIGGPRNGGESMRQGNHQSLDARGNKPLKYSDEHAISEINKNPQRNSQTNQMPPDNFCQADEKRERSENIVNTGGDSRNRRGIQPGGGGTGSLRQNTMAEALNSQTDFRNNTNGQGGNSRQPRQSRQKPGLPPRDLKSLKALTTLPASIHPTEITLPPELGNDSEIKKQLAEIAEKQMKMISNYKHDIERIAQEKALENPDLLSNAGSIREVVKKADQDISSFLKSAKGSDRKSDILPPNWEKYEKPKQRSISEVVHGKDQGHQMKQQQSHHKETAVKSRPWATGGDSKLHTQVRNQGEDKGTKEQRMHPLRSSNLQDQNMNYQENHNDERQHHPQNHHGSNHHKSDQRHKSKKEQQNPPRLHPTRTLSQQRHKGNVIPQFSPIDNYDNQQSMPTEDIPPYIQDRDNSHNNRNITNRVHQQQQKNHGNDQYPQDNNHAPSFYDHQRNPHPKEQSQHGHRQSTRGQVDEGRNYQHHASAEQRDTRQLRNYEGHPSSRNHVASHRQQHSMPERTSTKGNHQSNGANLRAFQQESNRHSNQHRGGSEHRPRATQDDKRQINPILKHKQSNQERGGKDITHRYLHQTNQEPIRMGQIIPGQSITKLLVNNAEHLFVVEPQPYLERPPDKFHQKHLADDDMKGLNEFDEVMRQNFDYERQVFKDLLWKNFDMWSETQKIDHLYALIEQYFYQVLTNDFHKIQVPVFMQGDVTRKLKSLAFQLYQTDAYILMQTSQTQEALFHKIEEAMEEVGLVNMHNFIQQELHSQIKLSRKAYSNGSVVQACGALPRSLQPMIEDIKEKVELDYHNEKMQQDQYDINYEHRPKKYGVPIYQDPFENSENKSYVLEREPSNQKNDNPYDMASPNKQIVKNQEKIIDQGAFHTKIVYPEEIDLIKLYGEKYKANEVNPIRNINSQGSNDGGNHYRNVNHQHPQEQYESPALQQSPYSIQNPFSPSDEVQASNHLTQQFSQDFQLNSAHLPNYSPDHSQHTPSHKLLNVQPGPNYLQGGSSMNQFTQNIVDKQIGKTLIKQSVQNAWSSKQTSQFPSPIQQQQSLPPGQTIRQDFSDQPIENMKYQRGKSSFDLQNQNNELTTIVQQDENVTKRSFIRHQVPQYQPKQNQYDSALPLIQQRRKSQFQEFIQIHEVQGQPNDGQGKVPSQMDQYKNAFASSVNQLQSVSLPPINNTENQVSMQDKKLSLAVSKHLDAINKASQDQSPYEQFVTQFFNQIKNETHQRYYRSNEDVYKQFNFNEAPTLEHLFKAKEQTLKRDGVIKEPKPTSQTLFEKIKQLNNPFIDELFIENNLTESERKSEHYEDKEAKLTLQIARYEQEFDQLRRELEELAKVAVPQPLSSTVQQETSEVVRLPSINEYQYQPIVKQGSLLRSIIIEEKIPSSKDQQVQFNDFQQKKSLENHYRSSMEQPLKKYESIKEQIKTSNENRGFQSSVELNHNVSMPQLEISRTESGKVKMSKKKDSIIILSLKNSQKISLIQASQEADIVVQFEDQINLEEVKEIQENVEHSLSSTNFDWQNDKQSPFMPKQPYNFLPPISNSNNPSSLSINSKPNTVSHSEKPLPTIGPQGSLSGTSFGGKYVVNKRPSILTANQSLTLDSYQSTYTLGGGENKK